MRQLIQFHIDQDNTRQQAHEQAFAAQIETLYRRNRRAFEQSIPGIKHELESGAPERMSLFVNKSGEANIVDYTNGRTLYGEAPLAESVLHVDGFRRNALKVVLNEQDKGHSEPLEWLKHRQPLPDKVNVLIVLGIGLGHALEHLLQQHDVSHVVIYEPSRDYFKCANFVKDWRALLALCQRKSTALYFQIGKNGANLLDDIAELSQATSFNEFYIYKHYNTPVFDAICHQLVSRPWPDLVKTRFKFQQHYGFNDCCPTWTPAPIVAELAAFDRSFELFKSNIAAFQEYFPDIAKQFRDYSPVNWFPVRQSYSSFNLLNNKSQALYFDSDATDIAAQEFEFFSRYPNKNGLILGYTGEKLKHYHHYQFVIKTEALIESVEEEVAELPEQVKSFILFGMSNAHVLQELLAKHEVEKLFICEPSLDLFYASLFNLDWAALLHQLNEQNRHVYINVGDDGSNLTKDLIKQFYSLGPYLLAQTYIYQGYANELMDSALVNLQEQLKLLLSMGDYFDHAFYGINHTRQVIQSGAPILLNNPGKRLSVDEKSVPIVLVGNGPSLDESLNALKEISDQAIIVSCGTALKTLYEHQITPDFHCEIEQNRSTFDWASRVGSFDYLKTISLISCNGIHPDTCALYKDIYLCFKEGEASTVTWSSVINKAALHLMEFAFPTVANFALDLFSSFNPYSIYLLGIDLGYCDLKKHHSQSSGYYDENGEELYDYVSSNHSVLQIKGNFQPTVYTKHEFKISKMVMEETLQAKRIEVYNCSNGAFIQGTIPLNIDHILLTNDSQQKRASTAAIKSKLFNNDFNQTALSRFDDLLNVDAIIADVDKMITLVENSLREPMQADIDALVEAQRGVLVDSVQQNTSLVFYYLYGSVNYASAALSKLNYSNEVVKEKCLPVCLEEWQTCLLSIQQMFIQSPHRTDESSSMRWLRVRSILYSHLAQKSILLVTNSLSYKQALTWGLDNQDVEVELTTISIAEAEEKFAEYQKQFDYVLYFYHSLHDECRFIEQLRCGEVELLKPKTGMTKVVFDEDLIGNWVRNIDKVTFCQVVGDMDIGTNLAFSTKLNSVFHVLRLLCDRSNARIVIPKLMRKEPQLEMKLTTSQPMVMECEVDWFASENWLLGFFTASNPIQVEFDGFGDPFYSLKYEDIDGSATATTVTEHYIQEALDCAYKSRPFILTEQPYV
ncbi:6-hydroxymethylpterin diphosphokinase MptE-like protein [Alteromonas flava]|uniref:motility associated factor glycosyltransferase family protein n=1 Tax=Alteromonas flava TaxID=2048003 RepID=UPI000C29317A|nr:6-hydroxymethylpterin diphosphokinase MptE-like protein [Alteromonas flava]